MPTRFGSPEYWQERADEARAIAADMADLIAKETMLSIAESYEKIAKRAEAREAGVNLGRRRGNDAEGA